MKTVNRVQRDGYIPALSLWQPWASLVILGEKAYETRSWATDYRGPLIIHAAKYWTKGLSLLSHSRPFFTALGGTGSLYFDHDQGLLELPRGMALGTVELIDVYPTEVVRKRLTAYEVGFGDYTSGRFAWALTNPRPFPEPVPLRGRQLLFEPSEEVLALARERA